MSKYLVTGGAGFVGTNIVKELIRQGNQVVVFDNYAAGKKEDHLLSEAEYVEGDIRNSDDLNSVCKQGFDGIFHLAALPRVLFSVENPLETHDVNVTGTLNVLLAAKKYKIKRVVFSTSSAAYGSQETVPFLEDGTIKKPISPYALHKFIGEEYCRLFSELYGVETVSLCYFNIYGPYLDPDGAYALVIGKFLKLKKENKSLPIRGDGKMQRDYVHVADVVRANILAMTVESVGRGEVVNIGSGVATSVNEIAALIGGEIEYVPVLPGEPAVSVANITKAKKLLGWEPTIRLEEGVAELKKEWGL